MKKLTIPVLLCLFLSPNIFAQSGMGTTPGYADPTTNPSGNFGSQMGGATTPGPTTTTPSNTTDLPTSVPDTTYGTSRGNDFPRPQEQQDPVGIQDGVNETTTPDTSPKIPQTQPGTPQTPGIPQSTSPTGIGTGTGVGTGAP